MTSIHCANAPCSWGILEFDHSGEPIAYNDVLDQMAESGFAGTELGDWGFLPTESDLLQTQLNRRGLALVGAFVPVALCHKDRHEEGIQQALLTAQLLAKLNPDAFIILADENGSDSERTQFAGRIDPARETPADLWPTILDGCHNLARTVREETGLQTLMHHHCAGMVETPNEIDFLMEHADPDLLGLCLDTGHYAYGGGDPLAALCNHYERIKHVHFKDCSPRVAAHARRERVQHDDRGGNLERLGALSNVERLHERRRRHAVVREVVLRDQAELKAHLL